MAKKLSAWKTKGMNRDLSASAFSSDFAFENMNLRLSTNEGNTLMSWVNEKGTTQLTIDGDSLVGIPIGTAVINHELVLFTTTHTEEEKAASAKDHIYVLSYKNRDNNILRSSQIYSGWLNLSSLYPLETIVSYESENIKKVYWTDGRNQPRLINIGMSSTTYTASYDSRFDFVPELQLNENIVVEKILGGNGMFAPGVIQYAFTYYKKYGQETNIFYVSPLLYISYKDRGASPEDKVENSFKITAGRLDFNFDYLRIYSIQRTSINGTPICKRLRDIPLEGLVSSEYISFIDTGTVGDSIDPTELLYKGGESIVAQTIEQKDSTLFLGNLTISRPMVERTLENNIVSNTNLRGDQTRSISPQFVSSGYYAYYNQLTSSGNETRHTGRTVPCGGFKTGDYYRCGVQFQYKTGKWSDPIWIEDVQVTSKFSGNSSNITLPIIRGDLKKNIADSLKDTGYKRIRPVVVFPNIMDRQVLCQGVAAPTVFTQESRNNNSCYVQSSWFFRPKSDNAVSSTDVVMSPISSGTLRYTSRQIYNNYPESSKPVFNPMYIRQVEIEGDYNDTEKFKVDLMYRTLHSPDIEFDEQMMLVDFSGKLFKQRGKVNFQYTMSDIDIQTETPTISSSGAGFMHKPFSSGGANGIVSGLFYDDFIVDDDVLDSGKMGAYPYPKRSCKWLVYPWQGNGYLNNDMNRPTDQGIASSKLKKKIISNLRYANTTLDDFSSTTGTAFSTAPQIFNSNEVSIIKYGGYLYKGNIDTMLTPDSSDGKYFCFNGIQTGGFPDIETPFNSTTWCKMFNNDPSNPDHNGIRKWNGSDNWEYTGNDIGDTYIDLVLHKNPVRMKYKSTPHLFGYFSNMLETSVGDLAVVEINQEVNSATRFGGTSEDALRENNWIPCGEPVSLSITNTVDGYEAVVFYYDYGDTYFQRYDCLKTYPFTREDTNQIVEIGSFMLETRVNIDGRYDRNRGQSNNLNMSPTNFNLMNPVYSQINNFFTYKIQPSDYYENTYFSNQITWSKNKTSGADVDLWTNITMSSTLELDGDKGKINELMRFNNQLICFQDSGISKILYNDNVQIASTTGVPIEIANSGKVQGKDYISSTIGCSNKWSIEATPAGIYFMDNNDKSIYLLGGDGLKNMSQQAGFNTWCKKNIPASDTAWNPIGFGDFTTFYDKMNQDVLFVGKNSCFAFSEKVGAFTSFYDYNNIPFFCNLDDTGIWVQHVATTNNNVTAHSTAMWRHHAGDYCKFFGVNKPYWMTLVGNPEPQVDKIFTNLEFRTSVNGEGSIDSQTGKFIPTLPFDSLETWDEYQHGVTTLENKNGHSAMVHGGNSSALMRKFRIWRCDIPRDNYTAPETDTERGISRFTRKPNDRMRNLWLYLKLKKDAATSGSIPKAEIHDIVMTYFD